MGKTRIAVELARCVVESGGRVAILVPPGLGMLTVGVSVLSGAAIAASIAVLLPMAAAQTLAPALIGFLGRRVLTRKQRAACLRGDERVERAKEAGEQSHQGPERDTQGAAH